MENFLLILEFFGGIIIVFAIGKLLGHLFKLDQYMYEKEKMDEYLKDQEIESN